MQRKIVASGTSHSRRTIEYLRRNRSVCLNVIALRHSAHPSLQRDTGFDSSSTCARRDASPTMVVLNKVVDVMSPCPSQAGQAGPSRPRKRQATQAEADVVEDHSSCPICEELWTATGDHRLCSLPCGHLFGLQCIRHWMENRRDHQRDFTCPTCRRKYASKPLLLHRQLSCSGLA